MITLSPCILDYVTHYERAQTFSPLILTYVGQNALRNIYMLATLERFRSFRTLTGLLSRPLDLLLENFPLVLL